jgi:hypothetical protein
VQIIRWIRFALSRSKRVNCAFLRTAASESPSIGGSGNPAGWESLGMLQRSSMVAIRSTVEHTPAPTHAHTHARTQPYLSCCR